MNLFHELEVFPKALRGLHHQNFGEMKVHGSCCIFVRDGAISLIGKPS